MTPDERKRLEARAEQIARAHAHAEPKESNPAWWNCHNDCGALLRLVAELRNERAVLRRVAAQANRVQALLSFQYDDESAPDALRQLRAELVEWLEIFEGRAP